VFQFLLIMDLLMVDPLLKDTPDTVVHWIQIRRVGWPRLWGMNSGISLCSNVTVPRARLELIDVDITSPGKGCTGLTKL